MQRVCENGSEAVPLMNVKVAELAGKDTEAMCKNAIFSERNTDMKAKLVDACAVKIKIHEYLAEAKPQITTSKTQLHEAQLALKKLTSK